MIRCANATCGATWQRISAPFSVIVPNEQLSTPVLPTGSAYLAFHHWIIQAHAALRASTRLPTQYCRRLRDQTFATPRAAKSSEEQRDRTSAEYAQGESPPGVILGQPKSGERRKRNRRDQGKPIPPNHCLPDGHDLFHRLIETNATVGADRESCPGFCGGSPQSAKHGVAVRTSRKPLDHQRSHDGDSTPGHEHQCHEGQRIVHKACGEADHNDPAIETCPSNRFFHFLPERHGRPSYRYGVFRATA